MKIKSIIIAAITAMTFAYCGETDAAEEKPASKTTVEEKPVEVQATALVAEYEDNEVAADNKYKDKKVTVTGKITSIAKDIADQPYVTLGTGNDLELATVQCFFKDDNVLASLKRGQKITVIGTVEGKFMNVMLKGCKVNN